MKKILFIILLFSSQFIFSQETIIAKWDFEDENTIVDEAIQANESVEIVRDMVDPAVSLTFPSGFDGGKSLGSNRFHKITEGDQFYKIQISTLGFSDITVSSKQSGNATSSSPRDFRLEYSLDEIDWFDVSGGTILVTGDWEGPFTENVALGSMCNNQEIVFIRWLRIGSVGINGNDIVWNSISWIDDIIIKGQSFNPNDNDSQISAGTNSEPQSIASIVNSPDGVFVFDFDFQDLGSGDNLSTIIDQVIINQGDGNEISDWTSVIAGAKLFNNSETVEFVGTINSTNISFSGENIIEIEDGTSENFKLFIWLVEDLSSINDNDILEFKIDYNNILCSSTGSSFGGGIIESGNSNNSISIDATELVFVNFPQMVVLNSPFSVSLVATDINGNLDSDANNSVTISKTSGSGTLSSVAGLTQNLFQGEVQWTDLKYNTLDNFSISASAGGFTTATTTLIECVESIFFLKDDFEDGNISGWNESVINHWAASNEVPINGNFSLKHTFSEGTTDIISYQLPEVDMNSDTKVWRFQINYEKTSSTSNNWGIFLMSDSDFSQMLPSGNANGYVFGVNYASGNTDTLNLWSVIDGVETDFLNTNFNWDENFEGTKGFEISRTPQGEWEVKIDENGGFDNLETIGSEIDNTHFQTDYFGIYFECSSTYALSFHIDDIYFGPVIPDTDPPTVTEVIAISDNKLQISFSEEINEEIAETITNYSVDSGIGNPTAATLNQGDNKTVELQFSENFVSDLQYSIQIQNIQDINSNIIETVNIDFVYSKIAVNNVNIISENQIDVYFSKLMETSSATELTNYTVNNSIGNPFFAEIDEENNLLVHLQFNENFVLETEYTLNIQNVEDIYGNSIESTNYTFFYYVTQMFDIIINELMIDVNPEPEALPANKYIEIFNNSNYDINLTDWKLKIGTNSEKNFPEFTINAYDYAIICNEDVAEDFEIYGNTIPILTESHLSSTTGKQIIIRDNYGNVIENITYSPSWYNDSDKDDGGWSLERIDIDNVCNQDNNWSATLNYVGGTPGRINSVFGENPDNQSPEILEIDIFSARALDIYFSENVDTVTATNSINYIINETFSAFSVNVDENDGSIIHLEFAENFSFDSNSLKISNISDYCGNTMPEYIFDFQYELIKPISIEVKSENQAIVYFSENVDEQTAQTVSNYIVNQDIGSPIIAARDQNEKNKVHLQFENIFSQDLIYSMSISNIEDIYENQINDTDLDFAYHIPKQFDIVINELMLDVNPIPLGLPEQQYIEIYNTTDFDIWLTDWIFKAESQSEKEFPNQIIKAKSYAILCISDKEREFSDIENVIPILSTSDLNNSGKNLKIYAYNDVLIYSVDYSSEWYQDENKEDGGWALEKIDPMNFCGEISNWKASTSAKGGTPGEINSIYQENPDNEKPVLSELKVVASNHIFMQFNKNISRTSIQNLENFSINNDIGNPKSVMLDDTSYAVVHLYFENQFADNVENSITIQNLSDDCGNTIETINETFIYKLIFPENIWIQNSNQLQIKFSENVDYLTGSDISNYKLNTSTNPINAIRDASNPEYVFIQFNDDFIEGQENTLEISNIKDVNGNIMNPVEFQFTYYLSKVNDIVINEILFNPRPDGADFVELYNRSDYQIDLINLRIGKINEETKEIESIYKISDYNKMFEPHSYLVLTIDSVNIKSEYETSGVFVEMSSMPSFPDDEGSVIILNKQDTIIDNFSYTSDMHFGLLSDENGVSLERIDFERPTNEISNWHSAAEDVGFATPGLENSQFKTSENIVVEDEFTIEPEVFSPDNDGYNDILNIHYEFEKSGYIANVKIYDSKGRLIRDLLDNELLSVKGTFAWDGLNDVGNKTKIGIYIVYIEIFDLEGNVKHYKKTCVVAAKI